MSIDFDNKLDRVDNEVTDISKQLEEIERTQIEIAKSLATKKKIAFDYEEDENKERGNWTGKLDFLLSCLGYAVGLGNVWRFPYLCYKNGGGAFFIPYIIMLVCVGIPLFLLELGVGQYSSRGPTKCWGMAPIFQGLGWGMACVSCLVALYYNVIIAWAIWYFFASWASPLPWESCGSWSTAMCEYKLHDVTASQCRRQNRTYYPDNGTCYTVSQPGTVFTLYGITDTVVAKAKGIEVASATNEYMNYKALQDKLATGIDSLGEVRWDMTLCLLFAWILVFLCMIKGIKSTGRVVYFTALFPYVVLIILFIRGLLLEGHSEGISFYIKPKTDKLKDAEVWKDAAVQIFFSLGTSFGGLIALASYNRFKTDCVRDAFVVAIGNCGTSVFAGFAIFSFLGHLAHKLGKDVEDVVDSGVGLAFIVYPQAVTFLPGATFWAIIFFLMLITLGLDSQFGFMETVITCLCDSFPRILLKRKSLVVFFISSVLFLLGLTMTTPGGPYMLTIIDSYSGGWNVMVLGTLECICVAYVYGVRRFMNDIESMCGNLVMGFLPWAIIKYYFAFMWCLGSPVLLLFIMIFSWVKYEPIKYGDKEMSTGANALGWLMTVFVLVVTFAVMIGVVLTSEGSSIGEKLRNATRPTEEWGPALVEHRQEVKDKRGDELRNFVVDPWTGREEGIENHSYAFDNSEVHGSKF